jgi:ACR3 family arsenite transporter
MLAGVMLGKFAPSFVGALRALEFGTGSQINLPIAVFIWLMIIPMMMKVDFTAIQAVGKKPKGGWLRCSSTGWSNHFPWL